MNELKNEAIEINNVVLNVFYKGPESGPMILILHGFPEEALSWLPMMDKLANEGYFVVAYDQRGYGKSQKLTKVEDYYLDKIAFDALSTIKHFKREKVYLIGHDWGAVVGWYLISFHAERIKKAVLMSAPHNEPFRFHLTRNLKQILRSWYIFLIQIPNLPEILLSRNKFIPFKEKLKSSAYRGNFPEDILEKLRLSWLENKSFTTMLNWYRAMSKMKFPKKFDRISVPVKLIWGRQDPFLLLILAEESISMCQHGELVVLEETGHWPHHEKFENLKNTILEYFGANS